MDNKLGRQAFLIGHILVHNSNKKTVLLAPPLHHMLHFTAETSVLQPTVDSL